MKKLHICKVRVVSEFSNNKPKDNDIIIKKNIDNLEDDNIENITLDIQPIEKDNIKYDEHYMSIVILYTSNLYDNINNTDKLYFISSSILSINSNVIPTYKIEYEPGFKFKKFAREKTVDSFHFRNKDIIAIKNINTNKNYHNYLVLVKNTKRIHNYENNAFIPKTNKYTWHTSLELYQPRKQNPDNSEVYQDISFQNIDKCVKDNTGNNKVVLPIIYRALSAIV